MEQQRHKPGYGAIDFDTAFLRPLHPQENDFDVLGHINNTVYVRWAQEMAISHWQYMVDAATDEAVVYIALRHEIDYRVAIVPGEQIEGRTWLGAARGPRFIRYVDVRKPGARKFSAFCVTTWCQLDRKSRQPVRISRHTLQQFGVPG